ncbi:MAG: DUF433 domain-containing protein [Candidatus Paceibacterota bacterium]
MALVTINKYIVADPEVCHGKLTFRGTRVMVWQILEMLAAGETVDEILKDFPSITKQHVNAALSYAAQIAERGGIQTTNKKFDEISCR